MADDDEELRDKVKKRLDNYAKESVKKAKEHAQEQAEEAEEEAEETAEKTAATNVYNITHNHPPTDTPATTSKESKKSKAWKGAKSMAGAGAGMAWSGSKKGAKAMFGGSYKIFFWLALLWHLVDALWMGFDRSGGGYSVTLAVYVIFAVWAWFIFDHHGFLDSMKALFLYFAISAFCVFAPLLRIIFPAASAVFMGLSIPELLHLVLFFIPVWAVYVGSQFNYGGMKLLRFVWFVIIVGTLIYFIFSSAAWEDIPGSPASKVPIGKFTDKIAEGLGGFWASLTALPGRVVTTIHNVTVGPDYQADVERNRGKQLGVYLESIEAIPRSVTAGDPIDIRVMIVGKSFIDNVHVSNACEATNKDFTELALPSEQRFREFDLTQFEERWVSCRFSGEQTQRLFNNKTTTVKGEFVSTFNFETWGYLTYSFITREHKQNMLKENKDVNQEYGLPKNPEAVYTDGPIMLGLVNPTNPLSLPYSIAGNPENDPIMPDFGITIRNKDPYGRVVNLTGLTFRLPPPLILDTESCAPASLVDFEPRQKDGQGNNVYKLQKAIPFERATDYITIRCYMKLEGGNSSISLLTGEAGIGMATLSVNASYDYELRRSTPFTIEPPIQ